MMPFSDPRFPGDATASHFQLVLRRRPDGKLPELDPDVREELSQIIAYLEALRAKIKDRPLRPLAPAQLTLPEQRDFRARRLEAARVRLGSRITDEHSPSTESILRDLALLTDSPLLAEHLALSVTETRETAPVFPVLPPLSPAGLGRGAKWLLALVGVSLLAAFVAAAFYWGRPAAGVERDRSAAASPTAAPKTSLSAAEMADPVLRAIQLGRLDTASRLLADAQKRGVALPGLRYQAALVALRRGDVPASMDWIDQSIAAREFVPECFYLRANSAASSGDYDGVCENLEAAANHAAFSPRYFFFWGEALRRLGHPAQAITQFERALLCRPNSVDTDLIRFKMSLAQIEAGVDNKFEVRLREALAQKIVVGDTLLLAAAVEINREAYPAAAEYLRRAVEVMPPALLTSRLWDFYFKIAARQPEIAAVISAPSPAGPGDSPAPPQPRVVLVDPATRSLIEADPSTW